VKKLILATILLAGCAAASGRDAKVEELERKSREIAARAKLCISAAMKNGSEQTGSTNGSSSATNSQIRLNQKEREQEISKCRAREVRENEELSLQQRKEYLLEAERERSSSTLMMILTTGRVH
jgi:hypothetical protein